MYLNPKFWGNQDYNFNSILPNYLSGNPLGFSSKPDFWGNQGNYLNDLFSNFNNIYQKANILNDTIINNVELSVQQYITDSYKLRELVNTDYYTYILLKNPSYHDIAIKTFVKSISENDLGIFIGDINVFVVDDWSRIEYTLDLLKIPKAPNAGDMLTVGNNIYVRNTNNLKLIKEDTANLLGHEVIHTLQAAGIGRIPFFNAYQQTGTYLNDFEITAYNYGGNYIYAKRIQLLISYPGWWIW